MKKKLDKKAVRETCNLIACTGLRVVIDNIKFQSKTEKLLGCMLGTADYLGQMSDRTYLEKLLFLYIANFKKVMFWVILENWIC